MPKDNTPQFCPIRVEDLDLVMDVERAAYPIPWTKSMFETSMSSSDECWLLSIGGEILGHVIISFILDEAHLLNLCVHPKASRRGLGRKLLQHAVQRAVLHKSQMFFLEVRVSNNFAVDLYFSEGFNEVGIRPNYYPAERGQREDALLMTLELSIDQFV